MHSHYGDAGYVAKELSLKLNVPFAHTAHSLGRPKKSKMKDMGLTEEEAEEKFKFSLRIAAEEACLALAEFIITSTYQEISDWEQYDNYQKATFHVLPPGIDVEKFYPYYHQHIDGEEMQQEIMQRKYWVSQSIEKFLVNPSKPAILALARPDRRKNLHTLIDTYGTNKEIQSLANLVIFAGIRKDIINMPDAEKEVLTEMLLLNVVDGNEEVTHDDKSGEPINSISSNMRISLMNKKDGEAMEDLEQVDKKKTVAVSTKTTQLPLNSTEA